MGQLKQETHSLELKSKPENLAVIRSFFKDVASRYNICESDVYDILISIGEAATNAVEHGAGDKVEVTFSLNHDELTAMVKSSGAFLKKIPLAEEDNFRGRGILLMLALMDRVSIDDTHESVTVIMSKKVQRQAS